LTCDNKTDTKQFVTLRVLINTNMNRNSSLQRVKSRYS